MRSSRLPLALMGSALKRASINIATVLASVAILCGLWDAALAFLGANKFIAKSPTDVFRYLFLTDPTAGGTAADRRHVLEGLLGVTLYHAAIGFAVGVSGAVLVALVFALAQPLQFMFMPLAMIVRTVPLLAMAPIIYLVFGDGNVTAGLIGAVVVFFPLVVNLSVGFAAVSPQAVDLIRACGGSHWTVLRKAAIPTALPHFFASMRIAVPGSITGAMLYEWLFTYKGLGAAINSAKSVSDYGQIWAIVAVVTLVSIVLYALVTTLEAPILAAYGPDAGALSRDANG